MTELQLVIAFLCGLNVGIGIAAPYAIRVWEKGYYGALEKARNVSRCQ